MHQNHSGAERAIAARFRASCFGAVGAKASAGRIGRSGGYHQVGLAVVEHKSVP